MRYIREMDFSNALYLRLFIKFAKWNKKNKFYLASWTSFSLVLKLILKIILRWWWTTLDEFIHFSLILYIYVVVFCSMISILHKIYF